MASHRGSSTTDPTGRLDLPALSDAMGSVTRAGRVLGFGWKKPPTGGAERKTVQHHLPTGLEATVVQLSLEHRSWGPVRLSNELRRRGFDITPWDVRQVWELHDLYKREQRERASDRSQAAWRSLSQTATPAPVGGATRLLRDYLVLAGVFTAIAWAALQIYSVFLAG